VTLAQLTALFADEALEWKAGQEAAAAEQAAAVAADAAEARSAPEGGVFLSLEFEEDAQGGPQSEDAKEQASEPETPEMLGRSAQGPDSPSTRDKAEAENETAAVAEVDPDAEAKRVAKTHERDARGVIRKVLDELIAEYAADGRGIEIREIAGGFRMATKPECHDAVRSFVKSQKPPLKLSLPALETLAVIAYKQPVTVPEVNDIRGVDSSGVFGSLIARKLITTAGRKQVVGRPILYKTTKEFLMRFGLKDVSELPSMEEFEKMAASELEEPELAGGEENETPAEEFSADISVEENGAADGTKPEANEGEPEPNQSARRPEATAQENEY